MEKDIKGFDFRPLGPLVKFTGRKVVIQKEKERKQKHYTVVADKEAEAIVIDVHSTDEVRKQSGVPWWKTLGRVSIEIPELQEKTNELIEKLLKKFTKSRVLTKEQIQAKDWILLQLYPFNWPMKKRVITVKDPNHLVKYFKPAQDFNGKNGIYSVSGRTRNNGKILGYLFGINKTYRFLTHKDLREVCDWSNREMESLIQVDKSLIKALEMARGR